MTKLPSERIQLLHEKLDKYKDDILKDKADGWSINNLARKYNISASTLGNRIYLWKTGKDREKISKKKQKVKSKYVKREFSPELKEKMRINTEINNRLVKHIKVDNSQDAKMIRYICGLKV